MKSKVSLLALGSSIIFAASARAVTDTKASTGTDLTAGVSWGDGSAPVVADPGIIYWTGTSNGAGLTLASATTWYGVNVQGAASNIDITGAGALTLGSGGIMIESTGVNTSIANNIALGGVQTWSVAAGKTLTVSGVVSGSAPLVIGAASQTSQSFLTGTAQSLFTNVNLSDVIATGGMLGGAYVGNNANLTGSGYLLSNNGSLANYWLEVADGGFTKGVKIELAQSGANITARSLDARYTSSALGYDFNAGGTLGTLATADANPGYGAHTTTLITKSSAYSGTVSLGGNNTFSGGLIVAGGTLTGSSGVAYTGTQGGSFGTGAITVNSGATLTSSAAFVIGGGQNTTRALNLNGGTLDIKAAGTGGEYIRTINMTGGTILTSDGGSGGATSDWFRAPNGGISLNSLASSSTSTISTRFDLTLGSLAVDVANGAAADDLLISGNITENTDAGSGARTLIKTGAGTLALSGSNAFTGNVTVNGGTLKIGNKNALGALNTAVTKVTVASGASVDFNGVADATYGYTISGTGVGGNGALVNNGSAIGNGSAQTTNIRLAADATIGGTGNWALLAGSFGASNLNLAGYTLTKTGSNSVSLATTATTAGTIRVSSGSLNFGVTNGGTGVNGNASSLILDNASGVALSLNRSSSIGSLSGGGANGGNISLGANTLTVGALNADSTYAGVISDANGQLIKTGSGKLTLAGANTYTGATTVSAGTLALTGAGSLASSTIIIGASTTFDVSGVSGGYTLAPGRTISGTGTVTGDITVGSNAILAPGNSPGDLSFSDDLTLAGTVNLEITGTTAGLFDRLVGDGGDILTMGGALNLNNAGYSAVLNDTITLFSGWSSLVGSFSSITGTDLGGGLSWDTSALGSTGTITVVPENHAALLGALGLLALLRRRR